MKRLAITLWTALVFVACEYDISNQRTQTISLNFEHTTKQKASNFIKQINYLLLEQDSLLPLVNPYKIIYSDSIIFIEDRSLNNLFLFSTNGKIKNIIKATGTGPGQFNQIDEFFVSGNQIYITDEFLRKTLVFDIQGNIINELKNEHNLFNQFIENDIQYVFFNSPGPTQADFKVINNIKNSINLYNYGRLSTNLPSLAHLNGFIKNPYDQAIYFTIPFSYVVARFSQNGDFDTISFDFGKHNFPREAYLRFINDQWNNKDEFVEKKLVSGLNYFGPTHTGMILSVSKGLGDPYWFLFNNKMDLLMQLRVKDLENDINGMPFKSRIYSTYKNSIILSSNSVDLYNQYNNLEKTGVNLNIETNEFFSTNKENLIGDRLVLTVIKLK
jgi:hypothetical protein